MHAMNRSAAIALALALSATAHAEELVVNPDAGNNSFSAVFDAALGERITAVSSAVGCQIRYDGEAGLASGRCSVPLSSIRVDNDDTKSDHFRQWATHKKSDPAACQLTAIFEKVPVGPLAAEAPAPFQAEIPFTVCGRKRADGKPEHVSGTAVLFPPGTYGSSTTIRIRATVAGFDRDAYRIGPAYTEGWLARVQSLAKVVAEKGDVELSLFARPATR
jgi:hypothetical protein